MTTFDQQDIRSEAEAFVAFVEGGGEGYGLAPDKTVFIGYSNGANMLAAVMLLYPGLIRNVVMMRAMAALEDAPTPDLAGANILVLTGREDPYGKYAPALIKVLADTGANIKALDIDTHHGIGDDDVEAIRRWMAENGL